MIEQLKGRSVFGLYGTTSYLLGNVSMSALHKVVEEDVEWTKAAETAARKAKMHNELLSTVKYQDAPVAPMKFARVSFSLHKIIDNLLSGTIFLLKILISSLTEARTKSTIREKMSTLFLNMPSFLIMILIARMLYIPSPSSTRPSLLRNAILLKLLSLMGLKEIGLKGRR